MSIRPVSRIASVTIALIFFFAALPLQAGFLNPAENFTYDGESNTGALKFSWKTYPQEVGAKIQYKGGNFFSPSFNTWITAGLTSVGTSDGKTHVLASRPAATLTGDTYKFRLSVASCKIWSTTHANVCLSYLSSQWVEIEKTF